MSNSTIFGTANPDVLVGTDQSDRISGRAGNDLIRGKAGNDSLDGGDGNDGLLGGSDSDTLNGGAGDDTLDGDGELRLFGLTDQNTIVAFDPNRPNRTQRISVSGVDGTLIGIDVRPANGLLYGISSTNKIYTIDPNSGSATLASTLSPISFDAGAQSGVDFNPVPDRLRLVGANEQNLRVNVDTGAIADFDPNTPGFQPDQNLAYDSSDRNAGANPNITAAAYTNAFFGPPSPMGVTPPTRTTQLFGIDSNLDTLVLQDPPNNGVLKAVGALNANFGATVGFDIFSPTTGNNVAYAVSGSTLYSLNLTTGAANSLGTVGDGTANFVGFAATIAQTGSSRDTLNGGDGNDTLKGGAGNDILDGGNGRDTLSGDTGNDALEGGNDNDSLSGGAGNDTLKGENGNDTLNGGDGDDALEGGDGNDSLLGGAGQDVLKSTNGDDSLDGGDGNDSLEGGDGNDILRGGAGSDTLIATNGNDALLGGDGSDTLMGGSGDDTLDGDGDVRLFGLTNQNTIVTVDPNRLSQTTSVAITEVEGTLIGIDVRPADGLLYGITDANKIYTIDPASGAATLVSTLSPLNFDAGLQAGVDFNPVPDRLRLVGSNEQNLRVNVDNGLVADNDPNTGGVQPDTNLAYASGDLNFGKNPAITAAAYTNAVAPSPDPNRQTTLYEIDSDLDVLVRQGGLNFPDNPPSPNGGQLSTVGALGVDFGASAGFDIFSPTLGINVAYAVSGSTLYNIDLSTGAASSLGGIGTSTASFVGLAANTVSAGSGNDNLQGGDGNDTLRGRSGDDRLTGGNGNDTLVGGAGSDRLTGDSGNDLFTFSSNDRFSAAGFGVDRVEDFAVGADKIVLDKTSFTDLQSLAGNGFGVGTEFAIVANDGAAAASSALIVYSRNNGNLFYNQNGVVAGFGTGAQFATIKNSPNVMAADFQIVA